MALCALAAAACSPAKPKPRAEARPLVQRDTAPLLRGIIGSESTIQGAEATLLTGYGLVVGLKGTGANDAPPAIRAWMEREMALRGVGSESMGMGGISPRQMLEDPNNCIVLVSATIAPCTPKGAKFDVLVSTLPGSAARSLEGGRLWTTDLRPGVQVPGGPTARILAKASGPIFINPFVSPDAASRGDMILTTGRILNGGEMSSPLELIVTLDNPSHSRARAIAAAINARFPQSPADREPTARGRNEEMVVLHIPNGWARKANEFLELVKHTRIDNAAPEAWATRYVKGLQDEPWLATDLSWCLQAIGPTAIPALRTMYESGEIVPRLAALRAGARLGDALATPHLKDIARSGPPAQRMSAIELLADMDPDPRVDLALRDLLTAPEATVRVAAYESLARRGDPTLDRRRIAGKFILDLVPFGEPMIYVSQQGEPKIAVFGQDLAVRRPCLVAAWSDRLLVAADTPTDDLRVMYTDARSGRTTETRKVDHRMRGFVEFLAHEPTPEAPAPGLNMSYSEVVGALYELTVRQGAIPAGFLAEQDKLQAEVLASAKSDLSAPRPELKGETPEQMAERLGAPPETDTPLGPPTAEPSRKPTYVVPIPPPPSKDEPVPGQKKGGG